MTVKQTFNDAPKLKIVTAIATVSLGDSEEGSLYYDADAGGLKLRTSEGWITFSED